MVVVSVLVKLLLLLSIPVLQYTVNTGSLFIVILVVMSVVAVLGVFSALIF